MYTLNKETELHVYFHWNQDNGPQLYGFTSESAKAAFMLVISVSGLGPKIGLVLLNTLTPEQLLQALAFGDTKALSSVSGIGPKKAELMIMQLKEKASKLAPLATTGTEGVVFVKVKEVSEALVSLNYSRPEISSALDFLKTTASFETASFDELLRKALAFLAKRTS
jgi:holliday junction DNA helicase RuvA